MKLVTKPSSKLGESGGKWLMQLVKCALKKHDDYFREFSNQRALLSGEHWKILESQDKEQVKMVINLANAHIRSLVPTLFFKNPSADCAPTAPQHSGKETTWNGIINNTLDKTDFANECKKVILDAATYAEGVMKHAVNFPEEDGTTSETRQEIGPAVWLSKGAPINVRIQPTQLIVDYLVRNRDVDSARFIAIRYRKPIHELLAHPIYGKNIKHNPLRDILDSTPTTGNAVSPFSADMDYEWDDALESRTDDTGEQKVTIYEVWVHQLISPDKSAQFKLSKQMCVLMEGQDAPIRELVAWEDEGVMGTGFDRFPVTRIALNEIPDALPKSEVDLFKSIQIGINWLTSRITSLVENDKIMVEVDMAKIKNPRKFRKQFYEGNPRILVEVKEQGATTLVQPTFVGRDNYTLLNTLLQLLQQVSGFGQNRRGGSGIRTATEASLVDQGTQIKTDEKVDTVHKFLVDVIYKNTIILRHIAAKLGTSWVFRVGGDLGAIKWINFTADDINWLPEVRIKVNSFRKTDSMQDMQKFAALLQTSMQLFAVYGPKIRVDLLFERMLESAGMTDARRIVGDQESQTMLQTLEIAAIIAGIPTPVLDTHDSGAHIQVIDAFVQSEMGQALIQRAPELLDALMQHRQEHEMKLQEAQQKAASQVQGINPFASVGQGNEQSSANQFTANDRQSTTAVGNGEFA